MTAFLSPQKKEEKRDTEKQDLLGSPKEHKTVRGGPEGICTSEALAVCFLMFYTTRKKEKQIALFSLS